VPLRRLRTVISAAVVAVAVLTTSRAVAQVASFADTHATIHVRGTPGLTLERRAPEGWLPICVVPCEMALTEGTLLLGVARRDGRVQGQARPIMFGAVDVQLDVHYDDRSAVRAIGWVSLVVGAVAGVLLALAGFIHGANDCHGTFCADAEAEMLAGAGLLTIGLSVGIPLGLWMDDAGVRARAPE
jgi:hypothetical protein